MMMNNNRVMEKQPVGQEQPLKCPRCDSSNTKFCYYNNYSLSQPRHFCKGCKRYWTRGGTLRNVPVGGGCRKNNKRIFKKSSSSSSSSPAPPILQIPVSTPPLPPQTKSQINYPMFYGLPITPSEPNYPFPRLSDSRVSRTESGLSAGYDNNNLDSTATGFLGYPSSSLSSNSPISSYPVFRSSTTLASLIASRLEQRKFNNNATSGDITNHDEGCNGNFVGMPPYNGAGNIILENGSVKMEGDGSVPMNNNQNVEETQGVVNINNNYSSTLLLSSSSSDPSFPWNGFWMDPSSVPAFSHLAS